VQRSIGTKWLAEAAYIGSQGRRLSKRYNTNAPVTAGSLYKVDPAGLRFQPSTGISNMLYSSLAGMSTFHALNLKMERRFSEGFSVLGAYSWSHSIRHRFRRLLWESESEPGQFRAGSRQFGLRHSPPAIGQHSVRVAGR